VTTTPTTTAGRRRDRQLPALSNPDQDDTDGDGAGDACDRDANGDGLIDTVGISGGGCQTGGSGGGLPLGLGLAAAAMLARRRRRARVAAVALAAATVPATASADERGFAVERFRLAGDSDGLLDVEGGRTIPTGRLELSLWLGGADDPLVVYDGMTGERLGRLVDLRLGGELAAAYGVTPWLEAQVAMPIVLFQDRGQMSEAAVDGDLGAISASGLGELRLAGKLWALRQERDGLDLALIPAVTVPTATADAAYLGDGSVGFEPSIAAGRRFGRTRIVLDLGYRTRGQRVIGNLTVEDELAVRAGVGVGVTPTLEWGLTSSVAVAAAAPFADDNQIHAEALTGLSYRIAAPIQAMAGVGMGLAAGYGTPDTRFMLAARYDLPGSSRPTLAPDPDGDGLRGAADACPTEAEDRSGDGDGCPDPVVAVEPPPPPAPVDTDGDGLADLGDACPTEAEDLDGLADDDGCPDPDDDGDGLLAEADRCPTAPGPAELGGCPDPDDDGDGVGLSRDQCPSEAGPADQGGCPTASKVELRDDAIVTLEPVFFATRSAEILPRSFALLDDVARVLANHGAMRIRVEGHTDAHGGEAYNLGLSKRRAASVRAYLIGKGIAADRLESFGFGEEQPVADNATADGRAANRRVVFAVIAPPR
jgi:MYXO-CTERM domain-containing protein